MPAITSLLINIADIYNHKMLNFIAAVARPIRLLVIVTPAIFLAACITMPADVNTEMQPDADPAANHFVPLQQIPDATSSEQQP